MEEVPGACSCKRASASRVHLAFSSAGGRPRALSWRVLAFAVLSPLPYETSSFATDGYNHTTHRTGRTRTAHSESKQDNTPEDDQNSHPAPSNRPTNHASPPPPHGTQNAPTTNHHHQPDAHAHAALSLAHGAGKTTRSVASLARVPCYYAHIDNAPWEGGPPPPPSQISSTGWGGALLADAPAMMSLRMAFWRKCLRSIFERSYERASKYAKHSGTSAQQARSGQSGAEDKRRERLMDCGEGGMWWGAARRTRAGAYI